MVVVISSGMCAAAFSDSAHAGALPAGFFEEVIGGAINRGTAMEFSPDGKLYVLEQTGTMQVYQGRGTNWTQAAPFSNFFTGNLLVVDSTDDRGLLGVAFDPGFNFNRYLYVYYTATTPAIHNRISRFTANANGTQVVAGSEAVIMDLDNLVTTIHNGGAMHFGSDGKLYVAVGENAVSSNAQSLSNRLGKILRLNPNPADPIPADNPATIAGLGSPTGNNRAIWCAGLRNPFTFAFKPGSNLMHINDVGEDNWEEVNIGAVGANYGWPTTEGTFNAGKFSNFTNPLVAYHHVIASMSLPTPGYTGAAITGGTFYVPLYPDFPVTHVNSYFFGEYVSDWIRRYDAASDTVFDFATSAGSPVDLDVHSDGTLFYLARDHTPPPPFGNSRVVRIRFGPECIGDVNHSESVNIDDLVIVITSWSAIGGPADLNGSGAVNIDDLVEVITHWGACP